VTVLGPIIVVFVILFVIPPMFLMGLGAVSALFGWLLKDHAEAAHEGSELIDLNY
jgi:hypothetical protein